MPSRALTYARFRKRAAELAASGSYAAWPGVQSRLEREGFSQAAEWLRQPNLRAEIDRACADAQGQRLHRQQSASLPVVMIPRRPV
jgi:hypothetical protein